MKSNIHRAAAFVVSILLMAVALLLLIEVGLPDRTDYTEQYIEGLGKTAAVQGAIAPPFQTTDLSGIAIDLLSLRGHPVIINFWATWCAPCEVEMEHLQDLYNEYQSRGLQIIAVNLGEDEITVSDWVEENHLSYTIVIDRGRQLETLYQLRGQPSTYVIDDQGIMRAVFYGPVDSTRLAETLGIFLQDKTDEINKQ